MNRWPDSTIRLSHSLIHHLVTLTLFSLFVLALASPAFCGPIHDAARDGDLGKVKVLLEHDSLLVFSVDDDRATPLHWAARNGHKDVVEFLIANLANVNAKDRHGRTPWQLAVGGGHNDVAELLFRYGGQKTATVNDQSPATPAREAAAQASPRHINRPDSISSARADDPGSKGIALENQTDVRPFFFQRLKAAADTGDFFDPLSISKILQIDFRIETSESVPQPADCSKVSNFSSFLTTKALAESSWYRVLPSGIGSMEVPAAFINPASKTGDAKLTYTITRKILCSDCCGLGLIDSTSARISFSGLPSFACISSKDIERFMPDAKPVAATDGVSLYVYQGRLDDNVGTEVEFFFRLGAPCALSADIMQDQTAGLRDGRAVSKRFNCRVRAYHEFCAVHGPFPGSDGFTWGEMEKYTDGVCGTIDSLYKRDTEKGTLPPPVPPVRKGVEPCDMYDFSESGSEFFGPRFKAILKNLTDSAPKGQTDQVIGAIKASPLLASRIDQLASTGKITEIRILQGHRAATGKGSMFGGLTEGSSIVLFSGFLEALQNNRFNDAGYDIQPNNTVFALGHLLHHLTTSEEMEKRMKTTSLPSYVEARAQDEAAAMIWGWNDMIDAAIQANGHRALSTPQISLLLANARYGSILRKAMGQSANPLQLAGTGWIYMNTQNISAVANALHDATLMDIE